MLRRHAFRKTGSTAKLGPQEGPFADPHIREAARFRAEPTGCTPEVSWQNRKTPADRLPTHDVGEPC